MCFLVLFVVLGFSDKGLSTEGVDVDWFVETHLTFSEVNCFDADVKHFKQPPPVEVM